MQFYSLSLSLFLLVILLVIRRLRIGSDGSLLSFANTHANTRHVRRRSLLRFNGCIKLIQIYIPRPDTQKGRAHELGRARSIHHCHHHAASRFTPRGCGFIIRRERGGEIRTKETTIYRFLARRRGGDSRESGRSSGTRGYGPAPPRLTFFLRAMGPPLCAARPDFRPIPRRVDSKRKRVRPCICAIRRNRGKNRRDLSREGTVAAFDQTLMGFSWNSLVGAIESFLQVGAKIF